jgi:hypothetical protein
MHCEALSTTRRKLPPGFWQATICSSSAIADVPVASADDPATTKTAASPMPIMRACTHPPFDR